MTKLIPTLICGTLLSTAAVARAADKAPAPAPVAAKPAAAPVAAKTADKPAAAPVAAKTSDKPAAAPVAEKTAEPAATAAPAGPPAPSPEIESLYKGWEGNWKCETTFAANSMAAGSPEVKTKSEVKIKKEPGGFWYRGEFKIKKSKAMPGMEGMFLLGYDTAAKAPVNLTYDSMGGYSVEHGQGATPDKLVFTGEMVMMGTKSKARETMTKKDDKNIEHSFEVDTGKGFQPMGVDVCKK